jgi:hypothetical protein
MHHLYLYIYAICFSHKIHFVLFFSPLYILVFYLLISEKLPLTIHKNKEKSLF